ncbi:hypothetical protein J1614_008664 [Plenodomus biglobosus]|nr:hypothetical protein J1614_008664 [Plenodomus biglobosus]
MITSSTTVEGLWIQFIIPKIHKSDLILSTTLKIELLRDSSLHVVSGNVIQHDKFGERMLAMDGLGHPQMQHSRNMMSLGKYGHTTDLTLGIERTTRHPSSTSEEKKDDTISFSELWLNIQGLWI